MKKAFLAMFVVSTTFAGANAFAADIGGGDGIIHFTGSITDKTCTVDAGDADQTVNLGNVSSKAFTKAGDKASPTAFKIDLTKCPATVDHVYVKFDGVSDTANANLLAVDVSADEENPEAKGVGIEIADNTGKAIPLHTASPSYAVDTTTNAATLNFVGRYVATAATVTVGPAKADSQFTINYP